MLYYPLTKAQTGVYLECVKHPNSTEYNNPWRATLTPEIDLDRLEIALKKIFEARKELHLHFTENEDGLPCQYVSSAELVVKRKAMTETEALSYSEEEFCRPFDLSGEEPLIRAEIIVTEENRYLLVDIHHLVSDGITHLELFARRDLSLAYEGKELPAFGYGILDYAEDEAKMFTGKGYERDKAYYHGKFTGMHFATLSEGSEKEGRILTASEFLERSLVENWCQKNDIPVNIIFQAAFSYTLSILLREENIMYISANYGRSSKNLAECYGMFVTNAPVLSKIDGNITVSEYLGQVRSEALSGMRHNKYPFSDFVSDMKVSTGAAFNFLGFGELEEACYFGSVKCPIKQLERRACFSDLSVHIFGSTDTFEIRVRSGEYQNPASLLGIFARAMKAVMLHMMDVPNEKLSRVSLLSSEDTERVMSVSRGKPLAYESEKTWVDLFCENAEKFPDSLAVKDVKSSLTYAELNEESDKVADYLVQSGVKDNDFVAVKMGRVKEFIVAILGINKAGAAYIPIDPTYPEERISYMLEDSQAKFVLTEETVAEILGRESVVHVNRSKISGLAYMIYTSGSTGKPKGAMILHRGLSAFTAWNNQELEMKHGTSHLIHSSFSFDASVFDMVCPLAARASVHILDEDVRQDLCAIADYLNANNITGMLINTQIGMELLNHYDLSIRYLMLGGDRMLPVRQTNVKVYNAYGPTEFTVVSLFYVVKGSEKVIPIGRPVPGSSAFICDMNGNLLPMGAVGELYLSGVQIGAGYYNQPELTAEKFVTIEGIGLVYRTGDLVRYNKDYQLEFIGRIDNQIKLRGFRVELGEIENAAASFKSITGVVARVKNDMIVLYYTADEVVDKVKFREFLSETLTEYMIPAVFVQLENMPLTPGGKVDIEALPEPELKRTAYEAPKSETERIIAESMREILGLGFEVGRADNFYELGGDSIKAIRLVGVLRQKGINTRTSQILKSRNIAELALMCSEAKPKISEGAYVGTVGDSAILKFFKGLNLPRPMFFNQSAMLKFEEPVNVELLTQALRTVAKHHDILRAVWKNGGLVVESTESDITLQDDEPEVEFAEDSPLIRASLVDGNLHLVAHHSIVDGVSWRIILDDIAASYAQRPLPPKTASYADYVKAQEAYVSQELPYWEQVEEEIKGEDDRSRKFGVYESKLDSEATALFLSSKFDKVNSTIEDGLLAALSLALNKGTLSVQMEGHGREDIGANLDIDRTVGWFTSLYPVVLKGLTGELRHDLLTVKEALHRVPNRGVGYGILNYVKGALSQSGHVPDVSFNYLGSFDFEIGTGRNVAPENVFGPGLAVNCMISGGQFLLRLEYDEAVYSEAEASGIARKFFENMKAIASFLSGLSQKVKTASDYGETEWSEEEFEAVREKYERRGETVRRVYPLTPMQEAMLLKHISEPDSEAYRVAYIFELDTVPSQEDIERTLSSLANKHEVLRTAIVYRGVSSPRQLILDRKLSFEIREVQELSEVFEIRKEILSKGFDLEDESLFKLIIAGKYIVMAFHHIIVDGWCLPIIVSDLAGFLRGESCTVGEAGVYERAVREILALDQTKGLDYFRELLEGYETCAEVPSYGIIPEDKRSETNKFTLVIDKNTTDELSELCSGEQVTLSNAVELAWARVLSVCSRQDDIVFAKVVSGRDKSQEDLTNVVGLFINSIPVRVKFGIDKTVRQMLTEIREQASSSNEYDYCSLSKIQDQTSLGSRLFHTILTFENYKSGDISWRNPYGLHSVFLEDENFDDISPVSFVDDDGQLCLNILFDVSKYSKEEIGRLLSLFKLTISQMVKNSEQPLIILPVLDDVDTKRIIELSKGPELQYDRQATWLSIFHDSVRKFPAHEAVVDAVSSLTYEELERSSDALAAYLDDEGVKPGDFVAIKMPHVKEFVVAVIGIHKAGAAYVPLDSDSPEERINYMLEDSGAKIVLDENLAAKAVSENYGRSIGDRSRPEQLAYMIYTSGSTGRPKGVMFLQSGLMNCAHGVANENKLKDTDRVALHFAFSFDSHVEDTFPPLMSGAAIYIMPEEIRKDSDSIFRFLVENRIDGCGFTTSLARLMIENYDLPLRYISPMGEALTDVNSDTVRILNKYGPTECCIISSYILEKGRRYVDVPIGRPYPNSYIFIVDTRGHLVPEGMAGELCYAGPQVGRGYWDIDEKTREVFVDCPFIAGLHMYHTGDLARYDAEGNLRYLGRIDSQVKVNGYRVEIGEIESCALQNKSVYEAAAVIRNGQIHLYYTVKDGSISAEDLKSEMETILPSYMLPNTFTKIEAMPHTTSGKIDRKALPEPVITDEKVDEAATELEANILALVSRHMKVKGLGVTMNLVRAGLTSLEAMRLSILLHKNFGKSPKMINILADPTVRGIAKMLESESGVGTSSIKSYEKRDYYPITENQRGLFIDWELHKDTLQYNVPFVLTLKEHSIEEVEAAVQNVMDAHCYLKTRLTLIDGQVMQRRCDDVPLQILKEQLDNEPTKDFFQSKVRPFDLLNDALYRIELSEYQGTIYLFIDIHHIINDGITTAMFIREVQDALDGKTIPAEEVTAFDFALYEQEQTTSDEYSEAEKYFDTLLEGAEAVYLEAAEIPDGKKIGNVESSLPKELVDAFCKANEVTAASFLQAAFAETLYRLTCQESLFYVTASNGRSADSLFERSAGMFVKIIPVVRREGIKKSVDYIKAFHKQLQESFTHEIYPYTRIVERNGLHAQISFSYQGGMFEGKPGDVELNLDTTKFPIETFAYPFEDKYVFHFSYDGEKYSQKDMKMFVNAAANVARELMTCAELSEISLATTEEREALAILGAGEKLAVEPSETIVSMFRDRASKTPNALALVYAERRYTYGQLEELTDRLAKYLVADAGVLPGDIVGVLINRSELMMIYPLAIMKAGAAYMPLDPQFPSERLKFMCDDAGVKLILSENNLEIPDFNGRVLRSVDVEARDVQLPDVKPEDPIVVLYTSGSTGLPKAVVLLHKGIVNLMHWYVKEYEITPSDKSGAYANFGFDAHMLDLYSSVLAGACVFIVPEELRTNLSALNDFYVENGITISFMTTQAGCLFCELNKTLRVLMTGGEKMPRVKNPGYRLINGYGPAECSLCTTAYEVRGVFDGRFIGRPIANCQVYVTDPHSNLLPRGASGELLISGAGVGQGYLNRPELTAQNFVCVNNVRAYRTGDRVRWSENGNLEFLGRLDNQVKLRGFRIELGEIEARTQLFENITSAAAIVRDDTIILYYTSECEINESELRNFLKQTLTAFMIPSLYVRLSAMPLNANGKIDRNALPVPTEISSEEVIPPSTELEAEILKFVTEQMHVMNLGVTSNLMRAGMSSLGAMKLSLAIQKEFGKSLRMSDVLTAPTVRGIAKRLETEDSKEASRIPFYEKREYYPITENQRGLFIDWELHKDTLQYNVPFVLILKERSIEEVEAAVQTVMNAHCYLKTRLMLIDGQVMQRRCDDVPLQILKEQLDNEPTKDFFQSKVHPFDLLNDALYRIELFEYQGTIYLFIDIHHIINDGLTTAMFSRELQAALDGKAIPAEEVTAFDFALYEEEQTTSDEYSEAEKYFDTLLEGAEAVYLEAAEIPDGEKIGNVESSLPKELVDAFCKANEVTAASFLQAAFAETLYRLTRQESLFYVTASNGRSADSRLERTAGMFVKTIPVVRHEGIEKSVDYIRAIHKQLQESFAHEIYPYTRIVERNGLHAQIIFSYQGGIFEGNPGDIELNLDTTKFPIEAFAYPFKDEYVFHISYDGEKFSQKDMKMFVNAAANVARELMTCAELAEISLAATEEREALAILGAGEKLAVEPSETIVSMFRDRASKTPNALALVYGEQRYTYGQLEELTDRLARYLVADAEVLPGDIVGVLINRSELMMIYPLAIMKAGAAYMPLDPQFPSERLKFMCDDAGVKLILSENNLEIPDFNGRVLKSVDVEARDVQLPDVKPEDPIVVLYTSGSTGLPKAVVLLHKSIVNFMHWYVKEYEVTPNDRAGAYANFGFDAHMIELYSSVLAGACSFIVPEELRTNLSALNDFYVENGITISFMTTQAGCLFSELNKTLRVLTTGGEKMPRVKNPGYRLINGYGPTECSIYTTTYEVRGDFDGRFIGRPIANCQVYVTDPHGNLLPRGASGELLISGVGVGQGYLNRPELTAQKFVSVNNVRAYRTGDLVRWSENGNLEFLGRLDNQVKLRGFRIELGEIEARTQLFENITSAAAIVRDDTIILYYTSECEINESELRNFLSQTLTAFMIPSLYVRLSSMPLNANGKTDRNALPEPTKSSREEIVPPSTELEEKILKFVSEQMYVTNLGVTTNLIRAGMSSLGAMKLSLAIQKEFGKSLGMSDILAAPTVREIAKRLETEDNKEASRIRAYEKREYYPITENQRGIYLDWELNRNTRQYNIPMLYVVKGHDIRTISNAIETAVNAHAYLKTRFTFVDDQIMQRRCDNDPVVIQQEQLDHEPRIEYFREKVRPFNLIEEPLYRIELCEFHDTVYVFMDVHHIIFDGLSNKLFAHDMMRAIEGHSLESETVTAYDFALYEKELEGSGAFNEAHDYFVKLLSEAHVMSYPNSVKPDGKGTGTVMADVAASVVEEAARKYQVTVGAYLQSVFAETMSRFMWEDNPMYVTINNGRDVAAQLERSVGMFVKTLPVVYKSQTEGSVKDIVRDFQNQLHETYSRELYPYTKLVEETDLHAEILFVYQGGVFEAGDVEGAEVIDFDLDVEKFPIHATLYPLNDRYVIRLDYNGNRYSHDDMEILAGAIKQAAISMASVENVKDIQLVSEEEQLEILRRSKGRDMEYDESLTWLDLLAEATAKYPDRVAVVDERRTVTYRELDEESNAVAEYLIEHGVEVNDFVAMRMDRWAENIIAIVGINKAGGAYTPIDLNYPEDRQQYMLEDSEAKVVLTEEVMREAVQTHKGAPAINRAFPEGNAYMIYTSGSTGYPKGTVLHHRGIVNFALATAEMNELTCDDRICLHSSLSFDAHTEDVFPPLIAGASIHVMPESVRRDPDLIYKYLIAHRITGGAFTTSLGRLLAMNYELPQRFIALMGEALTEITPGNTTIINKYGFTECTNIATFYFLEKGHNYDSAPIGYSMPNSYILILDTKGSLVPFGGIGEICFASPQVGYGYWKLEEKTAKVFTDCKWVKGMRLYHSGDLGRYNEDGVIEYIGRMDFQVKVRGYRVEFGEIESSALRFKDVYEAAAAVRDGRIVLYYTEKAHVDEKELRTFMAKGLADFLMPEAFVRLDEMPRTPSRKIDRRALPDPSAMTKAVEVAAPETELEKKLLEIVMKQVGTDNIGVTTNLITLGLGSLGIMRLSLMIQKELGEAPLVRDIMKDPTVRGMAACLQSTEGLGTYEKREYYPITENQRGLFIDWELHKDTLQYNVPCVLVLKKRSVEEVEAAVKTVMDAHCYLKTRLTLIDGQVMQKRCDDEPVQKLKEQLNNEPTKEFFQSKIHPFDLLNDALYRIELSDYQGTIYLFIDIHHIINDGLTTAMFISEVQDALDGKTIPAEEVTAFDFALYEQEQTTSDEYSKAEKYFDTLLEGAEAVYLEASETPDGKRIGKVEAAVSKEVVDAFCKANEVTAASFLQAAFAETLYRLTCQESLFYVTASNGRSADSRLERTAGMFVKTIPFVRREGTQKSADYIKGIHEQLQESFAHEIYPYTRIVERNGLHAQIIFSYQGGIFEGNPGDIELNLDTTKFPIEAFACPFEDKYVFHISYDGEKFSQKDMKMFVNAAANVAKELTICAELAEISLATTEEREALAILGAGEKLAVEPSETIVSMFRDRASKTPNALALVYGERHYTYGQLEELTDRLARYLVADAGVLPGDIVGVLINRSELMMIYPLAIMKAGAAYMPLDPQFPSERLKFMCYDAGVKLILSENELEIPNFNGRVLKSVDVEARDVQLPDVKAEDPIVVLYTSGSTGLPKAVVLLHKGIVNFMHWYVKEYEITQGDRSGAYSNFGFDAHMIELYSSVLAGACSFIVPEELRTNLSALNDFYVENGITISFITTQTACLLIELNKTLRVLITGGEKMPRVKKPDYRFINAYGPTECSLYTTTYEVRGDFNGRLIGRPIANYQVYVTDPHGNLLPRGASGELLISGVGVGQGYLNRPELTAEKFVSVNNVRAYRTGDRVRWSENGNLEFLGRLDNQVKLRGFRIELEEIETRAQLFDNITGAAAIVRDDTIILYYTSECEINESELRSFLSQTLTAFMIPSVYVRLSSMPLNANGKTDRNALPLPTKISREEIIPPSTELEEKILKFVSEQMHVANLGVTTNLVRMGMSSLAAMKLSLAIQKEFGKSLGMNDVLTAPTVREIAKRLETEDNKEAPRIPVYEKREYYPITENQRGLFIDWELHKDTLQYNVPEVHVLKNRSADEVEAAIRKVIDLHSYLKTRLALVGNEIMQRRCDDSPVIIQREQLENAPSREHFQKKVRPFNLLEEPLYRIELSEFGETVYMFIDVHHIIFDGLSNQLITNDIVQVLEEHSLESEEASAYDFALYEKEQEAGEAYCKAHDYFTQLLSEAHAMSYPNSINPDGEAGIVSVEIDAAVVEGGAKKFGVTAGTFLQSAFAQMMSRLVREENPMYLTINNGRDGFTQLEQTVGMFVKTLPVVCKSYGETVKDYVRGFQEQLLETYSKTIYPYTKLVEETGLRGEVFFVYQGSMFEGGEVEGAEAVELELDTLKFPLTLTAFPFEDSYHIRFDYDGKRYSAKDIEILAKSLKNVIGSMTHEELLLNVSLNTPESEREIVARSKGEVLDFETERTWLDYFSEIDSDNIAVVDENRTLTYRQLEKEANSLAAYLIERGVKANDFVALCMDRCVEFVVAVVAIHKAGAAYVPIDMNYPEQRRNFMLEDSEAKAILTRETVLEAVETPAEAVNLSVPDGYAYMIYTSGSTGQPKGTILHHRGLLNFTMSTIAQNKLTSSDRIGHHFSFSFDSHIEDLYPPLVAGASIHIMPESIRRDTDLIYSFLVEHKITGGGFTTAIGRLLVMNYELQQRYVALMGEALTEITPKNTTIINKYGPTECTNIVSSYVLENGRHYTEVPIGRSMPNGAVLILDAKGSLVPWGCVGELCYTGPQVGYGYWKSSQSFDSKLYHTGDLARYNEEGQLIYLGRIDNQVKVNGFRVEFGEIESAALRFNGVRQAAASVKHDRLILYYTESFVIDEESLKKFLAGILTDYMMPSVFVKLEKFPTTPSGKVDRKSLPEPSLEGTEYISPATDSEWAVAECLQKVLAASKPVGASGNFFELGGDSIKAIRIVTELRSRGITISVADIMREKTVRAIAAAAITNDMTEISQDPIVGEIDDTPIIRFFKELKLPVPSHFNQSVLLKCKENADTALLQKAIDALTIQHDLLRSVWLNEHLFVQSVDKKIIIEEYSTDNITDTCGKIQSGIKMNEALIRIALIHADGDYILFAAHHLIIDGVSWRILVDDLETAYGQLLRGENVILPQKTNTYADYSAAIRSYRSSYRLLLEADYWDDVQRKLLSMPTTNALDYSRPMKQTRMNLSADVLHVDMAAHNLEINDILLTAVCMSYAEMTGEHNVSIQIEGHGREDIGEKLMTDRTIGWFTSIYPVIIEGLEDDLSQNLLKVKETLRRVPNKGIGYNVLRSDDSFGRIAQIGFNYLGEMSMSEGRIFAGTTISTGRNLARENIFGPDLSINCSAANGQFVLALDYNSAKYTEKQADEFMRGIAKILDDITKLNMANDVTASDLGETEWSQDEFREVVEDFASRGEKLLRIYPLTPMQEGMLLKHLEDPNDWAYRIVNYFEIDTVPTKEQLTYAMNKVIANNEVLKTAIIYKGVSVPRQAIVDRAAGVEMIDIRGSEDPLSEVEKIRREILTNGFDLQTKPLVQLYCAVHSEESCYLIVAVHHAIIDGWSFQLLMEQLFDYLDEAIN